jgi:NAD(P)H-dependent flavin oxidoreductase YrpB (nitropropane dioxygenase family)
MNGFSIGDLHIKAPVVQGGMGVAISLSGLAAAVANQGGIGVISAAAIGMTEPDFEKNYRQANQTALKKHIRKAREMSNGVLGVNLMVALSDYEALLTTAIDEGIDAVFLGAGLPLNMPAPILEKGFDAVKTKFIPKVSGAKAAGLIFKYWAQKYNHIPDAVVVEGPLAGGHLGFNKKQLVEENIDLAQLVKETVAVLKPFEELFGKKIPVIAGGGIYDGHDMRRIMEAGASAVKMGTRFVTTHECDADIAFKESYLKSKKEDIGFINSPVGLPGRVIYSPFVESINNGETKPFRCPWKCLKSCNFKEVPYCISQVLHNSAQGKLDQGFAFAGANAYKAEKIESVKEVFDALKEEFDAVEAPIEVDLKKIA